MRPTVVLFSALLLAVASPVIAAEPSSNQGSQPGATTGSNQPKSGAPTADNQSVRDQIRKNLQDAGFSDISLMPSSFLVRAKDRDGNPVMMVIDPDSVTAVTEINPNNSSTTGQTDSNGRPPTAPGK